MAGHGSPRRFSGIDSGRGAYIGAPHHLGATDERDGATSLWCGLASTPTTCLRLAPAERRRLERMTDAEITAAANEDADNKPLTHDELGKLCSARPVRQARHRSG